ncbi:MAG: GHKL domain-containing protein, partial [Firmicutes bacterium]|nr:GHKL domain-containing protein [Bacillota bacterium]
ALNRSYFPVYLLAVLPVFLLATLNIAFLASRAGTFPDRYLAAFLSSMSLAVLVLTALTPLKIQAIGRAVAEAHAARKTAENVRHVGRLLKLIRQQHHDFHHHLQTVYGLLEVGCHGEAREYIRKTFQTVAVPAELVRTDHPHVTALLYTKLAVAEARGIYLEVRVNCSLQGLPLSPLEACALLGNLLDNALEAAAQAPTERRVVRLEIDRDAHGYVVMVANPGRVPASRPSRLFRPGYTTKPGHAGLGLAGVRETALRHGGTVAVVEEGEETSFRVRLPAPLGPARGLRFPPGKEGGTLDSAAGEWEA